MRATLLLLVTALLPYVCAGQALSAGDGARALQQQDRRLDADYRKLRDQLRSQPQQQARTRDEQRDWLQHRDFACSGSAGAAHLSCLVRLTATQADAVEHRLR